MTKTVSIYSYVYNHTDHLGNVRLSYALDASTGSTKILEESHYYPFGLKHANYNSDQLVASESQGRVSFKAIAAPVSTVPPMLYNYKYNGMEYQDEMGLNLYDMPFRDYDPAIGRWTGMDPVLDYDRSPYNGYDNNPVFWADPSGADVVYGNNSVTATGADISSLMASIGNVLDGDDGNGCEQGDPKKNQIVSIPKKGQKVLNDVTAKTTLGKIWSFLQGDREWTDSEGTGLTFLVNDKGNISMIKPSGASGMLEFISGPGALKIAVTFGQTENQIYHTFRHVEKMGLQRSEVINAIKNHFPSVSSKLVEGKSLNSVIEVAGKQIQYSAYKLSNGTINIGRIHGL